MSFMPTFITLSGPWGYPLTLLGLVILLLSGRALWGLARGGGAMARLVREQANAILFWGVASAVLGFLGQCHGTYIALNMILAAPEIDPRVVAEGFVISFFPTLFGLGILAYAFCAWIGLRVLHRGSGSVVSLFLAALLLLFHRMNGSFT